MNEDELFLYNFIFELGNYYPIDVSLLGGRFFATYSTKLPVFSENQVNNYKTFLQERLATANSLLSSPLEVQKRDYIIWIISFIENELINYNYRNIDSFILYKDGLKSFFSHVIQHVFLDIILLESITLEKRLQSFIIRNKHITEIFSPLNEKIGNFDLISLLEIKFIAESMNNYYSYIENALNDLNYVLPDNKDYLQDKSTNMIFFKELQQTVTNSILQYQTQPLEVEFRKEIFTKTIEYIAPNNFISQGDLNTTTNQYEAFKNNFYNAYAMDWHYDDFIAKLSTESTKTNISSSNIENFISTNFESISKKIFPETIKELIFLHDLPMLHFINQNSLYIDSQKLKRGESSKMLVSSTSMSIGELYLDIVTNLIPFHYIIDKNNAISYVHQLLRISETEEGIKFFLAYFAYQIKLSESIEIQSSLFLFVNRLFELAILDLRLQLDNTLAPESLIRSISLKTGCNEILARRYFQKLLNYPGSYYLSYLVFNSLQQLFNKLQTNFDQEIVLQEIFSLIGTYYASPVKLFIKKVEQKLSSMT